MEKVAIYLRKSRGDIEDLEKHKNQLLEIVNKHKWGYDIFEEIGSSNSIEVRKKMCNLLDCIKKGEYKKILIVSLDRLSRNELDQAEITKVLKENNVEIITPTKVYDLNTENDLLVSDFEKLLARQEYRLIKKRLFLGKENGAKQGYWTNGIPPIPYVYNRLTKELEINNEQLKIYRFIIEKMLEGYTTNKIAWELNKLGAKSPKNSTWSNNTIRRIAIDITQLGKINYKGEIHQGRHKAVKTLDEDKKIRLFLARLTKVPRRVKDKQKTIFALNGLVKCRRCGATHYIYQKQNHDVYVRACWRYDAYGEKCTNKGIKESVILEQVKSTIAEYADKLQKAINNGIENLYSLNGIEQQITMIKNKISKYDRTLLNIKEMIKEGIYSISEGKEELKKIGDDKAKDIELLDSLQHQMINLDMKQKEEKLLDIKKILNLLYEESSEEYLNDLLRTIIGRIEWYRENNTISIDIQFL